MESWYVWVPKYRATFGAGWYPVTAKCAAVAAGEGYFVSLGIPDKCNAPRVELLAGRRFSRDFVTAQ